MECKSPVLIPAKVPWSVASSAPHINLYQTEEGKPDYVTFIAYFKIEDSQQSPVGTAVQFVKNPGEFRLGSPDDDGTYRLVCLTLHGGYSARKCFAVSDHEVITEASFDWRAVPGALQPGDSVLSALSRAEEFFIETGFSANPGFYEVLGSPWLVELGLDDANLHHYIIVGHDEYFDIVAQDWHWKVGQKA